MIHVSFSKKTLHCFKKGFVHDPIEVHGIVKLVLKSVKEFHETDPPGFSNLLVDGSVSAVPKNRVANSNTVRGKIPLYASG